MLKVTSDLPELHAFLTAGETPMPWGKRCENQDLQAHTLHPLSQGLHWSPGPCPWFMSMRCCHCDVLGLAAYQSSPCLADFTSQLDLRPVTSLQSVWWSLGYGWTCTFPQRFCCQPHLPLWTYPLLMLSEVKVLYHNPSTCRQGTRIMITALKKILTNQL